MNDLLVLVPARLGSKGVPGKNFRKLGNRSLIERSIIHANKFSDVADIVVSTDNLDFIANRALDSKSNTSNFDVDSEFIETSWGYLHKRPYRLATDKSLIMDLAHYLVFESELATYRRYKAILLLQPTSPFRSYTEIAHVTSIMCQKSIESESFVSLRDVTDTHPARMYEPDGPNQFKGIFCFDEYREARRQDCPKLFIRDGGYYVIGRDLIRNRMQTRPKINGMVRAFPYSINIDSESDFLLSELFLDKKIDDPNELETL
jgi:CMP-N-acetylneuraminic acid synthetase